MTNIPPVTVTCFQRVGGGGGGGGGGQGCLTMQHCSHKQEGIFLECLTLARNVKARVPMRVF